MVAQSRGVLGADDVSFGCFDILLAVFTTSLLFVQNWHNALEAFCITTDSMRTTSSAYFNTDISFSKYTTVLSTLLSYFVHVVCSAYLQLFAIFSTTDANI